MTSHPVRLTFVLEPGLAGGKVLLPELEHGVTVLHLPFQVFPTATTSSVGPGG